MCRQGCREGDSYGSDGGFTMAAVIGLAIRDDQRENISTIAIGYGLTIACNPGWNMMIVQAYQGNSISGRILDA